MVVHKKKQKQASLQQIDTKNQKIFGGIVFMAILIVAVFYFIDSQNKQVITTPKQPVIVNTPKPQTPATANQTTNVPTTTVTTTAPVPKKKSTSIAPLVSTETITAPTNSAPDPIISPQIITSDRTVSASLSGLTLINVSSVFDTGYGLQAPIPGVIDDGFIQIPMAGNDFNFFGTNYGAANSVSWNSNNALTFGAGFNPIIVSVSHNTAPSILLGNFDRLSSAVYYSHSTSADSSFAITKILVKFANYYTDNTNLDVGTYQIRLIKEVSGAKRQWVEISVISSPPSPGYSNNPLVSYPSGTDNSGHPIDSDGFIIDQTKSSPYNITDGTTFLNPLGTLYSLASPPAGTSFIFQSDEPGNTWTFTNNAYVNL